MILDPLSPQLLTFPPSLNQTPPISPATTDLTTKMKPPPSPTPSAIEEDHSQYAKNPTSLAELEQQFPNRPHNHHRTLPFASLFQSLFNPLINCKPTSTAPGGGAGAAPSRRKGGHGFPKTSYHEQRRHIIERFLSRWRADVGNDVYPALRLILPDKDRDRGVYGLKESGIGKLLVKAMKIDRNSEDGYGLMHWKLPGGGGGAGKFGRAAAATAGDFAGRCFEVLAKRQIRTEPGGWSVGEVNVMLDRLAAASGEAEQLPVWEEFYRGMNAEEMMWVIRIVLKDMRVGATERTFLGLWHPDAEALFSVSSSLKRVCWELWDPEFRLGGQETGVTLMSCFQPQLAQFQMATGFGKLVANLGVTEEEPEFWIEEKLDGERMQMHMVEDDTVAGGFRFAFWSRKAKDYTYLYGEGLEDDKSALTRHLKNAFDDGVRNLILDGEMITWDPDVDKIMPFGTLKTAALEQQKNPFHNGPRPLYRVFDILLLNDTCLSEYTLADRRQALARAVRGEHRRLEILPYTPATSADAIEPELRKVVAEASEGLVLKNPRSRYRLNSRNNDWIKVKPEYMSEFGESLDCVVIGGYYGSGRRGGTLSSFLCGLRVGENLVRAGGSSPEKCLSVCKVGGGFKAEDYAEIKHLTEGKWRDWDAAAPPSEYVELGGGERMQCERPDVWIRPAESVVISIKAAQFAPSEQFAVGWTLRFPRFRKLRTDKAWDAGLDVDEFEALRSKVRQDEQARKAMEMESRKRKPNLNKRARHDLVIAGTSTAVAPLDVKPAPTTALFQNIDVCVLSDAVHPKKTTKTDLERLLKANGARIHQRVDKAPGTIALADKNVVRVAALRKAGDVDVVRPKWVFDCLAQEYLLPMEEGHMFVATEAKRRAIRGNTDRYGDSYARDLAGAEELRGVVDGMKLGGDGGFDVDLFLDQMEERGHGVEELGGFLFRRCVVFFAVGEGGKEGTAVRLGNYVRFGDGRVVDELEEGVTHVVVVAGEGRQAREVAGDVRYRVSSWGRVPRVVRMGWVEDSWRESTVVDEEVYAVV
ncbi:hypothetical protein QBC39DRAFT_385030 [Podospora conica]|nr:hypothetical protein QBC39DRAFT_385030 [Schizothecium conicum]